jgi:hypothetical protein
MRAPMIRTPLLRTLGPAWLAGLALVLLAGLGWLAAALLPGLGLPAGIAPAVLLAGAVLALVAAPLALQPAQALRASLASPEGTPVWGRGRADLWGQLAAAVDSRAPVAVPPAPGTAETLALLKEGATIAQALRRDAAEATAALHAATLGAARVDGAVDHVERRLANSILAVEHVGAQLAALRPAEAVAAVERAAALLQAAPPAQAAASPAGMDADRLERALTPLVEAMTRLAARPDFSAAAAERMEAAAQTLHAALAATPAAAADPALLDQLAGVATRLEDAAQPLATLATAAARLHQQADDSAATVTEARAVVVRLEALATTPAPVPDTAKLDAAVARLEALPVPVLDTAGLDAAVARLDTLPEAWHNTLNASVAESLMPLAERLQAAPEAVLDAVSAGLDGALAPARRDLGSELTRLHDVAERLAALPEATATAIAEASASSAQLASAGMAPFAAGAERLETAVNALNDLPAALEARVTAGAAELQDAAATLGAAAAEAMTSTYRNTRRAAEDLVAAAALARGSLGSSSDLAGQIDAVRQQLHGVAERLSRIGDKAEDAVLALAERSLAPAPATPAPEAPTALPVAPLPPAETGAGTVAGGLLASLREAADPGPPALSATLASLSGVESETTRLLAEAESLAEKAAAGVAGHGPTPMLHQTPAVLDMLDQAIRRLRSAATAIALATDSAASTQAPRRSA